MNGRTRETGGRRQRNPLALVPHLRLLGRRLRLGCEERTRIRTTCVGEQRQGVIMIQLAMKGRIMER